MRDSQILTITMLGFVAYLLSPIIFWFWLVQELESGAFPVNADSIGIPIAGFVFLWLVGWIVLAASYVVWATAKTASINREIQEQNAAAGVK